MAVGVLTIDDYARAIGHAVWLERRCFERFGEWARGTPEPAVKMFFAAASAHHGFCAALLEPLLPESRDHDPAQLVGPADEGWTARVDGGPAAGDTAGRLVAARELARLARESHRAALTAMTPVAEQAARRVLSLVIADHDADEAVSTGLG